MLRWLGVEPRAFVALVRAFVLMDLRGQHFAAATASRAMYVLSPLFIVVCQLLASSALLVLILYARAGVWFFAFAHLSLMMVFVLSTVVVEFQEVAINPEDLNVLGPRPVPPRTYAAARLVNLLFFFGLMFLALTVMPTVAGATLRDAGPWFAPAYAVASLAGGIGVLAVAVLVLSVVPHTEGLRTLKIVLSWAQILTLMLLAYGGQALLFRWSPTLGPALFTWGEFPPAWVEKTPSGWLARFVETPDGLTALALMAGAILALIAVMVRLSFLYAEMRPVERAAGPGRPFATPGRLPGGWLARGPEERAGYWLAVTFLRRDVNLAIRCLFAFQFALAVGAIGFLMRQVGNPLRETDPAKIGFTVLTLFLMPLAAPNLVYNLSYGRDSGGGWLLRASPVAAPAALARGACKAAFAWIAVPLCVAFGVTAGIVWNDVVSAVLHAVYVAGLTWVFVEGSLAVIAPSLPFSLPPARGGATALPPLPMALIGTAASLLGAVHVLAATYPVYWVAAFAMLPIGGWLLSRAADRRLARFGGAS